MSAVHYHERGWDFVACGRSGPNIRKTSDPEAMTCRVCNLVVKKIDGKWHQHAVWWSSCSGCFETVDGHVPYSDGEPISPFNEARGCYEGAGCPECGWSGINRNDTWLPLGSEVAS